MHGPSILYTVSYIASESQETHGDPEVLVTALKATQEKKDLLEQSLSAETKVKMDLFSALGEAKRDISMKDGEYRITYQTINIKQVSSIA